LCPTARMTSEGFPVRRGADAGHILPSAMGATAHFSDQSPLRTLCK
jgi:hypothetical protein